jgi:hypothetical protein
MKMKRENLILQIQKELNIWRIYFKKLK